MGVRLSTFVLYDGLAALFSVPALVYLAYAFGDQIDQVAAWAHKSQYGLAAIIGVVVGVFLLKRYLKKRKAQQRDKARTANGPATPATSGPQGDADGSTHVLVPRHSSATTVETTKNTTDTKAGAATARTPVSPRTSQKVDPSEAS